MIPLIFHTVEPGMSDLCVRVLINDSRRFWAYPFSSKLALKRSRLASPCFPLHGSQMLCPEGPSWSPETMRWFLSMPLMSQENFLLHSGLPVSRFLLFPAHLSLFFCASIIISVSHPYRPFSPLFSLPTLMLYRTEDWILSLLEMSHRGGSPHLLKSSRWDIF